jgi:RND family efflux transporter MFP subunit
MRQWIHTIKIVMLLFLAVAQWRCGAGAPADPAPAKTVATPLSVKALQAEITEWAVTVPFSGSLRSRSVVDVKSEVAGRLIAAQFVEGDQVKQGQLVAEIDTSNYKLAHDQAVAALSVVEAGIVRAQVMLDHARREKERADNLLRTGGITERDHQSAMTGVKDAEAQLKVAEAQRGQAQAAISVAEKALKDCRIFASAGGQVQRRHLDPGTLLSPGLPIYTLVDNGRLELEALIPSYRLAEVRPGLRARFTTPTFGEREFEGVVSAINPMIESDNRSVKVAFRISNPRGELRSGMFARGIVEVRRQTNALLIPRSALIAELENSSNGSIYVVANDVARRRDVTIGGIQQDRIWVQRGLETGELVIVEIGPALKDGAPVKVFNNSSSAGH